MARAPRGSGPSVMANAARSCCPWALGHGAGACSRCPPSGTILLCCTVRQCWEDQVLNWAAQPRKALQNW